MHMFKNSLQSGLIFGVSTFGKKLALSAIQQIYFKERNYVHNFIRLLLFSPHATVHSNLAGNMR